MCARDFDETERLPSTTDLAALQSSGLSMRASQGWGTVNDYALNCFDSSQATKVCLMKGHYRDGSGKLVFKAQGIVDRACDKEWCQCINLNPTPKCFLAAAGVLKCKRSDGQLVDTDVGSITASEHDGEELIQERDTGLDMVQPSQEAAVPSAKASALAQRSTEGLVKRHDYAMVCYESSVRTAICSRAGYYCDSRGRLRHNKNFDVNPDCSNDSLCPCVNLFPQPRCVCEFLAIQLLTHANDMKGSPLASCALETARSLRSIRLHLLLQYHLQSEATSTSTSAMTTPRLVLIALPTRRYVRMPATIVMRSGALPTRAKARVSKAATWKTNVVVSILFPHRNVMLPSQEHMRALFVERINQSTRFSISMPQIETQLAANRLVIL